MLKNLCSIFKNFTTYFISSILKCSKKVFSKALHFWVEGGFFGEGIYFKRLFRTFVTVNENIGVIRYTKMYIVWQAADISYGQVSCDQVDVIQIRSVECVSQNDPKYEAIDDCQSCVVNVLEILVLEKPNGERHQNEQVDEHQ